MARVRSPLAMGDALSSRWGKCSILKIGLGGSTCNWYRPFGQSVLMMGGKRRWACLAAGVLRRCLEGTRLTMPRVEVEKKPLSYLKDTFVPVKPLFSMGAVGSLRGDCDLRGSGGWRNSDWCMGTAKLLSKSENKVSTISFMSSLNMISEGSLRTTRF